MLSAKALAFMALLALQIGLQPLLTKTFVGPEVLNSSTVMACEATKCALCLFFIAAEGQAAAVWRSWRLADSLRLAGAPAVIYSVQNVLLQHAYRTISPLAFNVCNQAKLVATALAVFLLLGRRQSPVQVGALFMVVTAAVLLNLGSSSTSASASPSEEDPTGMLAVLGASTLSGLSGALSQMALQGKGRNSYLFSLELSLIGLATLLVSLLGSPDGAAALASPQGLFRGWTPATYLPVLSSSFGGVLVGLVTKHAGGVQKGFSVVAGILLTAVTEAALFGHSLSGRHWAAGALVAVATTLHIRNPPSSGGGKKKSS